MANSVIRLTSSEIATTAALGVNLTNADIAAKLEVGANQLTAAGSVSVGGVCCDQSGNIYVSDVDRHVILRIREGGQVAILAGLSNTSGINGTLTNVAPTTARFNGPRGLCCDKSGNIYVADTGNHQIRKITPDGRVSHVAGWGTVSSGSVDAVGGAAKFNSPYDVAVDPSGVLYVADYGNNCIRRIKDGTVYTFAGSTVAGDKENCAVTAEAIFTSPKALAVDANGNIFVCDSGNDKIKMITPRGWVYLFSGSGTDGKVKGTTAFNGRFKDLVQCDVDKSGNLYVVDKNTGSGTRVIKLQRTGIQEIVNDFTGTTSNDYIEGVAVSPAGKLFAVCSN